MDVALPYVVERKQFDKPIGEFQVRSCCCPLHAALQLSCMLAASHPLQGAQSPGAAARQGSSKGDVLQMPPHHCAVSTTDLATCGLASAPC